MAYVRKDTGICHLQPGAIKAYGEPWESKSGHLNLSLVRRTHVNTPNVIAIQLKREISADMKNNNNFPVFRTF